MIDLTQIRYPAFDKPEICRVLFYPRRERAGPQGVGPERLMIALENDVAVGGRFHLSGQESPTILFFHGNGEIAADYDDIGTIYRGMGINFLPVDYRGYGLSSGNPTVTAMMRDSHRIFGFASAWLIGRGFTGPLVVMGRSLGSAPALEIAFHNAERIAGLIIESGFARILPLLSLLGIDDPELAEASGPQNLEKIRRVRNPTLVIHAEYDQIIPVAEGKDLYEASGAVEKKFLEIPGADHN
ncbi:MAG: alpha/beta hydrolase, partial [Proteobacteria bacterium]|nr:alpha/beta hydrolase [Pseudomonadota bacterium]